ncbi:MAG: TIGR01777 family oxidoreductase [Acidimicrobiales bacterium]
MEVAVTGSSGLIGTALCRHLQARGDRVVRVVRRSPKPDEDAIEWHPERDEIDAGAFEGLDAVVNLAGESIGAHRWNAKQKQQLIDTRVRSTRLLSRVLAQSASGPGILVSGSAMGYYGDRGDEELVESSPPGQGFLAELASAWEAATAAASDAGRRVAHIRTGLVLDGEATALTRMLLPFKLGVGGRLGNGRQYWSWISLTDEVRAITWLLDHDISGPVNLVGPAPVTNAEFSRALGRALHRPALLPAPKPALELLLGRQLADELLFSSQRVLPDVLLRSGFRFQHETVDAAIGAALHPARN